VNLLGFDTATPATTACVVRVDGREFELLPEPARLLEPPAHARELMPALAEVMRRAELDFAELDAIAVGVGPGGFTGLRIGIATARALGAAHGIELRPVSSLAALAEGLDAPLRLPLVDARRGELFAALFEDRRTRWGPVAARPEEVAERTASERPPPRAAGDGSLRFRGVLEAAGIEVDPDASYSHLIRGLNVCRLAATAPAGPPEGVLPDYFRQPDAKPR
jgi:tRNA threonylcarbamoyladenosine biosynthesis protein TsaB